MAEQYLSDVHVYTTFHQPIGDDFAYTRFEFRTKQQPSCQLTQPESSERWKFKLMEHQQTLIVDETISQSLSTFSQSESAVDAQLVRKQTNASVDTKKKTSTDHGRTHLKKCDKDIQTSVSSMKYCKSVDPSEIPADSNLDVGGGIDAGCNDGLLDGKDNGQGCDESGGGSGGTECCAASDSGLNDGFQESNRENTVERRESCSGKSTDITEKNAELFPDYDEEANEDDDHYDDDESAGEELDNDDSDNDDQCVRRKRRRRETMCHITIKHMLSTNLHDVGMQVWMGAVFLCDYILHSPETLRSQRVLDLGAGVGLTSIVAGLFAREVYCTDVGDMILSLARANVARAVDYQTLPHDLCPVRVRELDWYSGLKEGNVTREFSLTADDITAIKQADVILAADVIYDCDTIDALFQVIRQLCEVPRDVQRKFLFSLEKRFVFTIEDLDITTPAYNYFRSKLTELESEVSDVRVNVAQLSDDFPKSYGKLRLGVLIPASK